MANLRKADLEQMNEEYFRSLEPEQLVAVAKNLHELAVEQLEKLEETSRTSSRPPSSDSPYRSTQPKKSDASEAGGETEESRSEDSAESSSKTLAAPNEVSSDQGKAAKTSLSSVRRQAGKQPGAKGKWRSQPLRAERIIPHYPEQCAACNALLNQDLLRDEKPHGGYYQFELNRQETGFTIECQLHHYYGATCNCGHHTQALPGLGECSEVMGRKVQLQLHSSGASGSLSGYLHRQFIRALSAVAG